MNEMIYTTTMNLVKQLHDTLVYEDRDRDITISLGHFCATVICDDVTYDVVLDDTVNDVAIITVRK